MILDYNSQKAMNSAADCLIDGGVIIFPCDTIYGFLGKAPETDGRIRTIKGRGEVKPFLVVTVQEYLNDLTDMEIDPRIQNLWPGPLTVIVPAKHKDKGIGTIAVRIPSDPELRELITKAGTSLYSTSVNRSGEAPYFQIDKIKREFENEVDLIVSGGDIPDGIPSTILDITSKPYRILRQGACDIPEELLK